MLRQRERAAAELTAPPSPQPVARPDSRIYAAAHPTSTHCVEYNTGWLKLLKMGYSVVRVLSSPEVPELTYWTRQAECYACDHSEIGRDGVTLFCRCCPCPQWTKAALSVKNRHAAHVCPREPAAF